MTRYFPWNCNFKGILLRFLLLTFLFQGQIFSGKDHRIYLLGNPVIFWAMLVFMGLFLLLYVIHTTRRQRGVKISEHLNGESTQNSVMGKRG